MPDPYLQAISVRPIRPEERARFDEELDEHHWLGHHLVGETMRHVAVGPDDSWVALLASIHRSIPTCSSVIVLTSLLKRLISYVWGQRVDGA